MLRLTSLTVSLALVLAGCHDGDSERGAPTNNSTTGLEEDEPGHVQDPADLTAAVWPDDLHRVVAFDTEAGVVIDGLNQAGQIIARVELADVDGSPNVLVVRADFADMHSWSYVDTMNGVLVQHGSYPGDDATITEITARAQELSKKSHEQPPDPSEPQPGPWLDCALSILNAVFTCLPVVGGGWLVGCPQAVIDAYCKCWTAKKKNKDKPKPMVCGGE